MVWMKRPTRLACGALFILALAQGAGAQTPAQAPAPSAPPATPTVSALDAELFYQLLLGEIDANGADNMGGIARILEAARKTNDARLYERAVELALRARSADTALQAARAWRGAQPQSREANRYVLQIMLALNRIAESAEFLKTELALTDPRERNGVLAAIPRAYARAGDKKLAATVVEQALADQLANPATGATAWSTVGRMRLAAGDAAGALEAARRGQAIGPQAEGPALLGLEMMEPKQPQAEALVRKYLEGKPLPEVRMAYARALLDSQRYAEASRQMLVVTSEKPELAEAWLVLGTLQVQDNQTDAAEASLKRYVELAEGQRRSEERSRGLAQAYLALSQIAEKRKDYALAGALLDRIDNAQDLVSAQNRRASILARQGKMDEARALLRKLPERTPADARMKLMAEVQLLRENKQYQPAYDLLAGAAAKDPKDADLLYDQAMLAEKLGNLSEMERLLRQVIALKPDFHHAYNALGYSLADRNVRLAESKQLILKALEFAPGDPFISDSLGWVEFRMGNKAEALRILEEAYKARPDAEIAAHLGEVLWSMGQRDRAQAVFKEGLLLNSENETLLEVIKRLRVKP